MKQENEICVKSLMTLEEIQKILKNQKFEVIDDFILNDTYYVKGDNKDVLEKLSDYILIREVVNERKMIVLKQKKYDSFGNIQSQVSKKCVIDNIEDAKELFENMGYNKFTYISDHNYLYSNGVNEIYIQVIEDKIYFEIEEKNNNATNNEELENILKKYNLLYDNSNLFVKKVLEHLAD